MKNSINTKIKYSLLGFGAAVLLYFIFLFPKNNRKVGMEEKVEKEEYEVKLKKDLEEMDEPELFTKLHREIRTRSDQSTPGYSTGYRQAEMEKLINNKFENARIKNDPLEFVERGPGNIGGRTRIILVMPDDPTGNTWLAGAVAGGIWKTTDAGENWIKKTPNISNLATTTLAYSDSDPSILYAGTGESFAGDGVNGSGMYKSIDSGETWTLLPSTTNILGIQNINRIIVDPEDPNTLLVCGRQSNFGRVFESVILKSTDGGDSWTEVFDANASVQQLIYEPGNFNIQYTTLFGTGVYKSTDGGETWFESTAGLSPSGRVELGIAPTNTNWIYASAQGDVSGSGGSDMYLSRDGGTTWSLLVEIDDGTNIDHLGGQGGYDNCVVVHPFNENIVYVGGVNLFKFDFTGSEEGGIATVLSVDRENLDFIDFVNFNAGVFDGNRLAVGDSFDGDAPSVEIRFGEGLSQMAHRFSVEGQGAGVAAGGYLYQDYVEIPFQVWDIDNERQLMVSFRDQQDDGNFSLIAENTTSEDTENHSREYIFIHDITYADSPNGSIAQNGGQEFSQLYFYWPYLAEGATFDPANPPSAVLRINTASVSTLGRITTVISDAYDDFNGPNSFTTEEFESQVGGIHPDHHYLATITGEGENFKIISVNDGGVHVTNEGIDPGVADGDWNYASGGYNTSQFYGADKRKGRNQYIGGMQDNSTWFTALDEEAISTTRYRFAVGGDGFDAVWNKTDPLKLLGSIQFNTFRRSLDGGETWSVATLGMTDTGNGNAPFVSVLANDEQDPDRVYAIGPSGVWISEDFAGSWELSALDDGFGSRPDVKISLANPDIVWAGSGMSSTQSIFVSTDKGESFTATTDFTDVLLGNSSAIETHPTEPNTAYVLFSFSETAKILKTTDLGTTWEDISGFGTGTSSSTGFPDVGIYSLFVFPNETDRIWAGTEIGIVESMDNGASWAFPESNLPATAIWQMKLVDNQIVLATHGRGIWTYDIPDLVTLPVVTRASTSLASDLLVEVSILSELESFEITVNEEVVLTEANPSLGVAEYNLGKINDGSLEIIVNGVSGGNTISSDVFEYELINYLAPTKKFASDFDDEDFSSFLSSDYTIDNPILFDNPAIHSPHPYGNGQNYIFTLRAPIIVDNDTTTITYSDIAIVEPGEDGTSFGDEQFWDYVVVEGSKDGANWTPLADGYDASLSARWLAAYNNGTSGSNQDFFDHEIDLLDTYEVNDTILVRFRLFADAATNGWGWVVDNLKIQDQSVVLSVENELSKLQFSVSPNPFNNSTFSFVLPEVSKEVMVQVWDLSGSRVQSFSIGKQPAGKNSIKLDGLTLSSGVHFAELITDFGRERFKIIKE